MRIPIRTSLLAGLLNLILVAALHAAAGDPDLGFAGTGRTHFGFGFGEDFANAVALQANGKLVVAGSSGENSSWGGSFSVVRYNTNDTLDLSFGNFGKVVTPIPGSYLGQYAQGRALQIQADGKIVLGGTVYDGTNTFFVLVRYHPNGSLDDSFGTGGIITTVMSVLAYANAMLIQPDGKILLAGTTLDGSGSSSGSNLAIVRYLTNGDLDPSFGIFGKVLSTTGRAGANALALQASGKILVAGALSNNFAVIRYTSTGALDTTFGSSPGNGVLSLRWTGGSSATALAIQPGDAQVSERIVVVGQTRGNTDSAHYNMVLTSLDVNGFSDFLFGFFGSAIFSIAPAQSTFGDFPTSIAIQGAGAQAKIIVAGFIDGTPADRMFTARFSRQGVLDPSWDGDGKTFPTFSANDDDQANAMTLVPGGKLVVVGSTGTSPGNHDFALARYNLSDGSLDGSFDQDGKKIQDVGDRSSSAGSVALQPDGKIILAGSCYNGTYHSFAVARLDPTGLLDPTFGLNGRVVVPIGNADAQANAVAIQADGKIVAVGSATNDIAVVRLNTNGTLDTTFDGDGIVTTSFSTNLDAAHAVAIQPDGRIVVVGSALNTANSDFAIVRYRTNGLLDASFNTSGKATTAFGTGEDAATGVTIQPDGKIVASGYGAVGGRLGFSLVRYNTNGTRDASFGTSGRVTTAVETVAAGLGQVLQPDGKILLAGYSYLTDVDGQIVSIGLDVLRYNTNGTLDNTFGSGGIATTTSSGGEFGGAIALQPDGKVLVGGLRYNLDTGVYEPVVVRFLSSGVIDADYGDEGTAVIDPADDGFNLGAFTIDSLGRALVAGTAGGVFGIARLQTDPHVKVLSVLRLPNRHTVLMGAGVPGSVHTLEGSTNVAGPFAAIGTVTADSSGRWEYNDAGATNMPRRFYRLALP